MAKLINFNDKGKWGYYNSETRTIIPAQFQEDSDFVNGFAIVKHYSNSCYGVIDEAGKEILPFIFSSLERQGNGLFKAGSYYFSCLYSNKGEIVDANGIALDKRYQEYDVVKPFGNDMYLYKKGNISGVMYNNEVIVERKDDYNFYVEIEQYPSVFRLKDKTGSFTYYDYHGQQILPEALELKIVSVNYIIFYAGYNKGKGIANVKGEILLTANYDEITYISGDLFTLNYHKNNVKYDAKKNSFIVKDGVKEVVVPKSMDWCGDFENGKAAIAIDCRFGVIERNNSVCVPCDYEEVRLGYDTYIIVKEEGKYHLLDYLRGIKIYTCDDISYLGDNYFVFKGKEYGIIDNNGTIIISDSFNKDIELLDGGCLKVSKGYSEKKYCVFDAESHIIISTSKGKTRLPQEVIWVNDFSDGLAIVENANGLKGVINEQGEFVIPCRFIGNLSDFHNGLSIVSISFDINNRISCLINKRGHFVFQDDTCSIDGDYQLVLRSTTRNYFAYNGKWGVIDRIGNVIVPFVFDRIEDFHGYYKVRKGNSIGILDNNGFSGNYYGIFGLDGNEILPCKYPRIDFNNRGLFEIIKTGVHGTKDLLQLTINQAGKIVISKDGEDVEVPQEYDYVDGFEGKYAKVKKSDLWGLIEGNGNIAIDCKYTSIGRECNGYIDCYEENNAYLVSLSNNNIISLPSCKSATYYNDNCIVLDSHRIVTKDGNLLFDDSLVTIDNFQNGYAVIRRNEFRNHRCGLIAENGKIVIPCEYGAIDFMPNILISHVSKFERNGWSIVNSKYLNIENKTVLIGTKTPFILPSQYAMGGSFVCGLAKVAIKESNKIEDNDLGFIGIVSDLTPSDLTDVDLDGVDFDSFNSFSYDEICTIHHLNQRKYDYKWGFIDENGNEVIQCKYDYVEDFNDGCAIVVEHRHKTVPLNNSFIVSEPRYKGVISLDGKIMVPSEFDDLVYLPNAMFKARKNGKWGIIDKTGRIIIPIEYLNVSTPSENLVPVEIGKKTNSEDDRAWGYVNYHNDVAIEPNYSEVHGFSEGLAIVKDCIWKVIDDKGDVILECPHATSVDNFVNGKSQITLQSGKNYVKHTLLKNGHIIVGGKEIEIDLKCVSFIGHFHDGLAKVCIQNRTNNKWGFINQEGVVVISDIPCEVSDFNKGIATYIIDGFGTQYIDTEGNLLLREDNNTVLLNRQFTAIAVKKICDNRFVIRRKTDNYYAIIDKNGSIIVPFNRYDFSYIKKSASQYINGNYNYIKDEYIVCNHYYNNDDAMYYDVFGKRIIPDPLSYVVISSDYSRTRKHFSEGLAAVSNQDGLWGFVNEYGHEQIPCIYDEVHDFNSSYCIVRKGNSLCLIDKTGNLILSGDYQSIEVCNNDIFIVTHDWFSHELAYETTDEYGSPTTEYEAIYDKRKFNKNGEIVIPFRNGLIAIPNEYEWCDDSFHEGFLSVYKDGKWGVINTRLEVVVDCIYNDLFRFENDIAIAKTGIISVVINNFGHTLFFGDYDDIKRYDAYNLFVCHSRQGHYDIYNGMGVLLFSSDDISSRIQIPETTKMSSNKFKSSSIVPLDDNFFKYSVSAKYENRYVKKWGVCGIDGKVYLEACLDEIGGIGSGLVSAARIFTQNNQRKQLWGYVDIKGNVVIDYKYAYAKPFSRGTAQVSCNNSLYHIGGLGLISTDGTELTDFVYEKFEPYSKGEMLAYYQYNDESPMRITEQGAIHYEYYEDETCKDAYLYGYDWCSKVYHGLCIVMKGRRYGIIEVSGAISFPLSEMGNVKIVANHDGFVAFNKREVYRDVTKEGRIITYLNENRIELPVGIHWCEEWIDGYIAVESNGKWGLLNKELVFVLETIYESIQYIGNKRCLCCLKEDDKDSYSIYNIETDNFLQLPYDECSHFENGCAVVSKVMKEIKHPRTNNVDRTYAYGLIDNTGQELLPCEYAKVQFKKPIKYASNNIDDYEEPYDWESGYLDAFEGDPEAIWGREW